MKKKLLYLTSIMLFSALSINAQNKTWDFGADAATWGVANAGMANTTNTVTDNLGLYAGDVASFGAVQQTNATFADTYKGTAAFKFGGPGFDSNTVLEGTGALDPTKNFLPEQRFVHFNVTGPCTVKVWFRTSSNGTARSAIVTDGVSFKASVTTTATTPNEIVTANYTGGAGKIYIFSDIGANLFKIQVIASGSTGLGTTTVIPTLGTDDFNTQSNVSIYANDGAINVSNLTSATKVSVYSVLGSLVKSTEINADASLAIGSGFYIVKAQSAEGTKTVKVLVK